MGELRQRGRTWWVRYYRAGRRYEESSHSTKKKVAIALLRQREGAVAHGVPVTAAINRFRFDDAAADLLTEYRVNRRVSIDEAERRIRKHLMPYFTGRRMSDISPSDVRTYVAQRQAATEVSRAAYSVARKDGTTLTVPAQTRTITGVSNAEINRELALLKRMFRLAVQAERLIRQPHISLLEERNARAGFFEPEQLDAVISPLPAPLRPVIAFAAVTGWRIDSEVLTLRWHQVDFDAGEIRLDPETTKNRAARTFPTTDDLRRVLDAQYAEHLRLAKAGQIVPWVFVRMIAKGRGGTLYPKPITSFGKAWRAACVAAGCPGRIPHDLRRTAIRTMVRRGVPERVAMALAGHKTRSVFERYNIVSTGDLQTARVQLSGLFRTPRREGTGS